MNGNRSATIEYFPEGYSLRTLYKIVEGYLKKGSTTHLSKLGRPKSQKQRDISRKVVRHLKNSSQKEIASQSLYTWYESEH